MPPRVIAILAARNGAAYLERTTAALGMLTRRPDVLIAVDAGSTDGTAQLLAAANPAQLVSAPGKRTLGGAVAHAIHVVAPEATEDDWLWILGHDNAPEPTALAQLLAAVEIAPSVAVAGPKLMRWDGPDVIAVFGETMTTWGTSIALVENELDQAQHDIQTDVLGVTAGGMLVRRSLWTALGGFDPGLPGADAALDFSIRARLAGHRVVMVPGARVASAGGPEQFGRKAASTTAHNLRLARAAQLHRRLVYAPVFALPVHWLSLLPLAVIRSIGHLIAKRPGAVAGEFLAAITAVVELVPVSTARRNLRRIRRVGWGAIAPLRLPWAEVRERRAQLREAGAMSDVASDDVAMVGFAGGGLWVTIAAAMVSLVIFGTLLGANAIVGGGLLPLSNTVAGLWAHIGYGWREIGVGFIGPADPFSYLLAILGSITFWMPSLSIVVLYLLSLPLAAIAAWFCARRLSRRGWLPIVAAILWVVAPPFLGSLISGHLGAVIAHLLLPWLVLACIGASTRAARSWSSTATAALLFAAIAAAAPILVPALLVGWVVWLASRPKSIRRLLVVPLPTVVLFAPLVAEQLVRGNLLGLLADPGVPAFAGGVPDWQLALGTTMPGLNGWAGMLESFGLVGVPTAVIVAALLAPLGILAVLALFLRGSRRAIACLAIAFLGFVTAVIASHLQVTDIGSQTTAIWAGTGLSLFWLGLIGSTLVALDAIGPAAVPSALLLGAASCLVAVPLLGATLLGTASIQASSGRVMPAVVSAQADSRPDIGTLILTPEPGGGISVVLQRGHGTTLDDQSTLDATVTRLSDADVRLATLAGNVASLSGYNAAHDLGNLTIGFVVLQRPDASSSTAQSDVVYQRAADALDGNDLFAAVGSTRTGLLWRAQAIPPHATAKPIGNIGTPMGVWLLTIQGVVFGITLLLAIPTEYRRRRVITNSADIEEPVGTFDEDENV